MPSLHLSTGTGPENSRDHWHLRGLKGPRSKLVFTQRSTIADYLYVFKVMKRDLSLIKKIDCPYGFTPSQFIWVFLTSPDEECEVKSFVSPGFLLSKASGLNHGSRASSPQSFNDSLPMITRQDPGWLRRCLNQNPASMETGSAARSTASPLNSCLSVRAVTSALWWKWRWRALHEKGERNNKAAFFHKGDLSPFYEPPIVSMKRGPQLLLQRPIRCWWKSFMEVFKERDQCWADGKSSTHLPLLQHLREALCE